MKGPGAGKELAEMSRKDLPEKFQVLQTRKFRLPFSKAERTLVVIRRADNRF
jgi:16S rRNA G527 N7-methylase RsmG